jgi:hypothetical protein
VQSLSTVGANLRGRHGGSAVHVEHVHQSAAAAAAAAERDRASEIERNMAQLDLSGIQSIENLYRALEPGALFQRQHWNLCSFPDLRAIIAVGLTRAAGVVCPGNGGLTTTSVLAANGVGLDHPSVASYNRQGSREKVIERISQNGGS